MSNDCKYLEHCPIWINFEANLKYMWIKSYCQGGKQCQCKRRIIMDAGDKPHSALLPDGTVLPKSTTSNN